MFSKLPLHQTERNWDVAVRRNEEEFQVFKAKQVMKFDSLVLEGVVAE